MVHEVLQGQSRGGFVGLVQTESDLQQLDFLLLEASSVLLSQANDDLRCQSYENNEDLNQKRLGYLTLWILNVMIGIFVAISRVCIIRFVNGEQELRIGGKFLQVVPTSATTQTRSPLAIDQFDRCDCVDGAIVIKVGPQGADGDLFKLSAKVVEELHPKLAVVEAMQAHGLLGRLRHISVDI